MDSKSQISSALDALDATFATEHQSYCVYESDTNPPGGVRGGWFSPWTLGTGVHMVGEDSLTPPPTCPPRPSRTHDRIVQASAAFSESPRDSDRNSYVGLGLGSIMPILNTGVGDGESSLSTIS